MGTDEVWTVVSSLLDTVTEWKCTGFRLLTNPGLKAASVETEKSDRALQAHSDDIRECGRLAQLKDQHRT